MTQTFIADRKFCPGCRSHRSLTQFGKEGRRFCDNCVRRGRDRQPESPKTAGKEYQKVKLI